jgi:hypothetical protein
MRRVRRLSLHLHSDKEARRSTKETRRIRPRGLPQTRHSLFFIVVRGEAIMLPIVGTQRLVHSIRRKDILRHLATYHKQATFQLLFQILHPKNPIMNLCWRQVHGGPEHCKRTP